MIISPDSICVETLFHFGFYYYNIVIYILCFLLFAVKRNCRPIADKMPGFVNDLRFGADFKAQAGFGTRFHPQPTFVLIRSVKSRYLFQLKIP